MYKIGDFRKEEINPAVIKNAISYAARSWKIALKTSNEARKGGGSVTYDSELGFAVVPNGVYIFRANIFYTLEDATADFTWRHAVPASPTAYRLTRQGCIPGGSAFSNIAVDVVDSASDIVETTAASGNGCVMFDGVVANGNNDGYFLFKWDSASALYDATVLAGSYLQYTQVL